MADVKVTCINKPYPQSDGSAWRPHDSGENRFWTASAFHAAAKSALVERICSSMDATLKKAKFEPEASGTTGENNQCKD